MVDANDELETGVDVDKADRTVEDNGRVVDEDMMSKRQEEGTAREYFVNLYTSPEAAAWEEKVIRIKRTNPQ